jgi:hypothetical protein
VADCIGDRHYEYHEIVVEILYKFWLWMINTTEYTITSGESPEEKALSGKKSGFLQNGSGELPKFLCLVRDIKTWITLRCHSAGILIFIDDLRGHSAALRPSFLLTLDQVRIFDIWKLST